MIKCILWGTGRLADECFEIINTGLSEEYSIISFCDNDYHKWGVKHHNITVIPPSELRYSEFDILVIANRFEHEVREEIIHLNLCDSTKVFSVYELKAHIFSHFQYEKLNQRSNDSSVMPCNTHNIIVYTALIGSSYSLKDPHFGSPNIKYICFTNNKKIESNIWEIRYVSDNKLSDVKLARRIKTLPWDYLESDGIVCWIDTKFEILSDLSDFIAQYWSGAGMLCCPHFERECICDEAGAIIPYKPDIKKDVICQVAKYMESGYPTNNGLFDTGCIVRDMSDEKVKSVMKLWWTEIENNTYRDQISLPYILWKTGFKPDVADVFTNHNKWFWYSI